jgi:hypothetical protein
MTVDEKLAMQMLIIDEMTRHREDQPTMLIDALLADQGFAFLHHLLSRRASQAVQAAQTAQQLVRALQALQVPVEPRSSEEVA